MRSQIFISSGLCHQEVELLWLPWQLVAAFHLSKSEIAGKCYRYLSL